jgi:hypothetical protein
VQNLDRSDSTKIASTDPETKVFLIISLPTSLAIFLPSSLTIFLPTSATTADTTAGFLISESLKIKKIVSSDPKTKVFLIIFLIIFLLIFLIIFLIFKVAGAIHSVRV